MKPSHFDLTVHDVSKARTFFETVLGWRFERLPMPYEYYRIQVGLENEPGTDRGKPMTQVTMPVPHSLRLLRPAPLTR